MLWNSFGSIVNLACQWLITILIVRLGSGYEASGVFSLAMSIYNIFAPIAQYRMYTYQVSDVENENTTGEYLAFRFFTCGVALALCTGYSLFTCESEAIAAILLYAVYKSISLVVDIGALGDQRHHRMDYIGKSLSLGGSISCCLYHSFLLKRIARGGDSCNDRCRGPRWCCLRFAKDPNNSAHWPQSISFEKCLRLALRCLPIVLASIAAASASSIARQCLVFKGRLLLAFMLQLLLLRLFRRVPPISTTLF